MSRWVDVTLAPGSGAEAVEAVVTRPGAQKTTLTMDMRVGGGAIQLSVMDVPEQEVLAALSARDIMVLRHSVRLGDPLSLDTLGPIGAA